MLYKDLASNIAFGFSWTEDTITADGDYFGTATDFHDTLIKAFNLGVVDYTDGDYTVTIQGSVDQAFTTPVDLASDDIIVGQTTSNGLILGAFGDIVSLQPVRNPAYQYYRLKVTAANVTTGASLGGMWFAKPYLQPVE